MNEKLHHAMKFVKEKKKEFMIGVLVLVLVGTAGTFVILSHSKTEVKDGWVNDGVAPQYYEEGELQKGLLEIDGSWFYFGDDGFMKTGFVEIDGKTYYFDSDGKMVTGFMEIAGSTYYFDKSGVMATGKVTINGIEYDFGTDGKLILDEGNKIEVTEDEEGNQTVVVKDKDGKEVSKVTVNESKPENVSVPQGSTGKETSTDNSRPSSGGNTGNGGSSSGGSGSGDNGSNNSGGSGSGGNTGNGGSSSGGSGSGDNGSNNSGGSGNGGNTGNGGSSSGGSGSGDNGSNNSGGSGNGGSFDNGSTEDKPDNSSHWWDGLSVSQIRAKVTASMVWKNEITGQTYKGVDGLSFAWNQEDFAYGGLKLISNPYGVDMSYNFPGGRKGMIAKNTFEMFWNIPEGTYNGMKSINLGTFTISIPKAISIEEVNNLYK